MSPCENAFPLRLLAVRPPQAPCAEYDTPVSQLAGNVGTTLTAMAWNPPQRGAWVEKLVAFGQGLGDDGRSIVSLRAEDLLAGASTATGLDDAGDSWFREPMERLCSAIDDEAELHFAGRI